MTLSSVLATVMRNDHANDRVLVIGLELSVAASAAQWFRSGYTYNIPWGVIIGLETRPILMVTSLNNRSCLREDIFSG